MTQRAAQLKKEASNEGVIDPPVVDLVRWTSYLDWGQTVATCLQEAGFNVEGVGGNLTYPDGIAPSQESAFGLALYVCDSKYTLNPTYSQTLTADQWGLWYDYDVEWLVPCVAAFGVTASQPPSRDTFIAQGLQQGYPTWDTWGEAQAVYSAKPWQEEVAFMETCPYSPPNQYLWGG